MLCQFTIKNYKSIKDELTLDMQATPISEHTESIIKDRDNETFLPLAAIYGPNGSGKSNIINGFNNLLNILLRPVCALCDNNKNCPSTLKKSQTIPFRFSDEYASAPTDFELFFRTDIAEYKYNLSIHDENIICESLNKKNIDGKRHSPLFTRDNNEVKLYGVLKNLKVQDISQSISVLSYLAIIHRNHIIDDVFSFIHSGISVLNLGNPENELKCGLPKSDEFKALFLKMLTEMDIDIKDFRVQEHDEIIDLYTKHVINNNQYELDIMEESSGTFKLFTILPFIIESITNGTVLIVDELDAKLHPSLLKYIIELYRNHNSNKKGAQLIYTSHELSTMNSDLFRRDEIWFVAKNDDQSTKLYSLVEFKDNDGKSIRKDARYEKQYLEGKYGADPYLRRIINWEEHNNVPKQKKERLEKN